MDYNEANYSSAVFQPGDTITFNYTGNYNTITLPPGKFLIECWGAQGGQYSYGSGKGGYTSGVINLSDSKNFYIYVGQYVGTGKAAGGWNGGGNGGNRMDGRAGGGASDIRLTSGTWNNITSLRSRIMVAAGGGGEANVGGNASVNIGNGGGLVGGDGVYLPGCQQPGNQGLGAKQNAGGTGRAIGDFGVGGSSYSGGGGGYYGGGGGWTANSGSDAASGGGGSSFISGMSGCNAIDINGNHTNQPIHYSGLYFEDTLTQSGINSGNGKIMITVVLLNLKVLFFNDNYIQYFANNQFNILTGKNLNNITVEDFLLYGADLLTTELNNNIKNITILSMDDTLLYKTLRNTTIIYDPLIKKRWDINKINKITINDIGNIVYMIHNGNNIYSWKNNEWGKYHYNTDVFSNQDLSNMIKHGMTSMTVNSLSENDWHKLYLAIDSYKCINFLAVLNSQNIEDETMIKNITITKDGFMKQTEIKDYMFEEEQTQKELILTWNTTNKSKIKIIYEV